MPMTEAEIREWCRLLGPTPTAQANVIRSLLTHAVGDSMTAADRVICHKALRLLTADIAGRSPEVSYKAPSHAHPYLY